MKYNTTSYKCNESNTIIGYSTKKELPESLTRVIDGETITLWKQ